MILMNKTERITIAGFGGQGVMTLGQIIAYAGAEMDLNSLWFPSYGPETRGGTANCAVTVSAQPINSPVFAKADVVMALNKPSLDRFCDKVITGGKILYNSSLIEDLLKRENIEMYGIPINDIANELGNLRVANMVMLGAYLELSSLFTDEVVAKVLRDYLGKKKEDLLAINLEAIKKGRKHISEGLK